MEIVLDQEVIEKYPNANIGFLLAKVSMKASDPYVEDLKKSLLSHLEGQGINATNFAIHPSISIWREIYEKDFEVKPKTYRSSLEALLRRVITGKDVWNISNIVDLYNCCSIFSLVPMGGYDLKKVKGDITIRFAKLGETFIALGSKERVEVKPNQVVYADEERIMCWLWNHKDSRETCIDEESEYVLFFLDAFDQAKADSALLLLKEELEKIHCSFLEMGVLNKTSPKQVLESLAMIS